MNLIVAVTENWGIGRQGDLLLHVPGDMRFFREKTSGATVIMGRTTLESLPGGQPLKNRTNIVLTRDRTLSVPGAVVVHDVPSALAAAEASPDQPAFVIGGASVYAKLLPYCSTAFVTKFHACPPADRFFPDLDADSDWVCVETGPEQSHEGLRYQFCRYENLNVKRAE